MSTRISQRRCTIYRSITVALLIELTDPLSTEWVSLSHSGCILTKIAPVLHLVDIASKEAGRTQQEATWYPVLCYFHNVGQLDVIELCRRSIASPVVLATVGAWRLHLCTLIYTSSACPISFSYVFFHSCPFPTLLFRTHLQGKTVDVIYSGHYTVSSNSAITGRKLLHTFEVLKTMVLCTIAIRW
jgi:hypothetical protein